MSSAGSGIRVLHVDDDRELCDLAALHLERANENFEVVIETSAEDGLDRLRTEPIDCVVSDHDMPGMDGIEFLETVRERDPDVPFILYTGKGSEEIASDAISAGVTDYLQKGTDGDQYELLANRIENGVSEVRAREALAESERMFSTLVENLPGMAYRCRNERGWPMEFVSEGADDLTGYPASALESGAVDWSSDVLHEDDREAMWEQVQTAIEADEPFEVTYRIQTADGDVRWMWERGREVERKDGSDIIEGFVTDITARRTREHELAAEREFTRTIIDALDDVFYLVTVEGEFVRWNERLNEVTGYTDEEVSRLNVMDLFPEEYEDTVVESTSQALRSGTANFEAEIVTSDGDRRRMEFRGTLVDDEHDELTGICGIARDVTDRVERERSLEQYRTLVENVGDSMYVLDDEGTIQMVNQAMAEQLGYPREEIVGRKARAFMPEDDVEAARAAIRELLADDDRSWATVELQTITVDGEPRYTEDKIAVLTNDDGEFVGSVGIIRDITDRKRRERELQRYETVIQAVGDPMYTLDTDGRFTFVNDALATLTGYDVETLIGEPIGEFIDERGLQRGREKIQTLLRDDQRRYAMLEMDVLPADGDRIPCENHIALLPMPKGTFRGTAGVIRDVTARKEREQRLEKFASVVSHDLRNPLEVIAGRVELARETGDIAHLEAVDRPLDRMHDLIEELLELAHSGEGVDELRRIDVANAAQEAWYSIDTDGATLEVVGSTALDADPGRLQALFENLFRNAIEHGTDGEPEAATRATDGSGATDEIAVTVGTTEDGFFVADDGVGIPEAERETIFEHGYTTRPDGTGYGLAIVADVVEAHEWTIRVAESEAGGARFEIDV